MNLRDALRMPSSDVTEESVYRDRRRVLAMLGAVPALGIAGCSEAAPPPSTATVTPEQAVCEVRVEVRRLDRSLLWAGTLAEREPLAAPGGAAFAAAMSTAVGRVATSGAAAIAAALP